MAKKSEQLTILNIRKRISLNEKENKARKRYADFLGYSGNEFAELCLVSGMPIMDDILNSKKKLGRNKKNLQLK